MSTTILKIMNVISTTSNHILRQEESSLPLPWKIKRLGEKQKISLTKENHIRNILNYIGPIFSLNWSSFNNAI